MEREIMPDWNWCDDPRVDKEQWGLLVAIAFIVILVFGALLTAAFFTGFLS